MVGTRYPDRQADEVVSLKGEWRVLLRRCVFSAGPSVLAVELVLSSWSHGHGGAQKRVTYRPTRSCGPAPTSSL
jgi:hypothetical protein